ncbi:hypothetical protein BC941DRAFT_413855 [Chlamydoabsidia padenii]|nr:hypothetical protein BC941DRAFT_413855 [Chlamydoabsidia padenii]
MAATTGTRVFFVESTAHWEALQRERAQFHSTTTTTDHHIITKKQPHGNKLPQRDSTANRIAMSVGKPGSRRRKRWDNNHLKDNPAAVLYPEDLKPPGHPPSRVSFLQWDMEDDDTTLDNNNDDDIYLPHLTRQMRHGLKRHHIPEGWVMQYEQQLVNFLSRQDENELLTWEIDDSYLRWLAHAICRYHNVDSYSETTQDGRRLTFVNGTTDRQLEQPLVSFLDYIKK